MGLRPNVSSSSYENIVRVPIPNPEKFIIQHFRSYGDFLIVLCKYPESHNYEGVKLMVFKGININELLNTGKIDPHFFPNKYSPVARFRPTDEGLEQAIEFCISSEQQSYWR